MNAIILSIGDELVLGQTLDTNSQWLSQQLAAVGCDISGHVTVGDDQRAIEQTIAQAAGRCDVLICTGGIGPTADDLTRQALAGVMDAELELNGDWLAHMQAFFARRSHPMPEGNRIQAMIPRRATMIWNHNGTAAGIRATLPATAGAPPTEAFIMPGVPKEMKAMFARDVLPFIQQRSSGAVILSRTLHTFGMGESAVAQRLGDLMDRTRNPSVGTTVSQGIVSLRINARFPTSEQALAEIDSTASACRAILGDLIYGQDEQTLPHVIAALLLNPEPGALNPLTVTTAESCTAGLLAKMLTDVPGSSAYFNQGWVTYSNQAKTERLGVSQNILNVHGAVSEPVVEAMARHARRLARADLALAISGVAGPDGGTPAKPVGTVCIALAFARPDARGSDRYSDSQMEAYTFLFPGDREWIRDRSAKMALTMLRYHLIGKALPEDLTWFRRPAST